MSKEVHKNKIERLNVFLEKFTKKYGFVILVISIILILLVPLIIACGVTFLPGVSIFHGTSSSWIGFWGSFMGGILGTIGIIFVAYLQNNKQQEENEKMMITQRELNMRQMNDQNMNHQKHLDAQASIMHETEQFNKQRIAVQFEMDILQQYNSEIEKMHDFMYKLKYDIKYYIGYRNTVSDLMFGDPHITHEHPKMKPYYDSASNIMVSAKKSIDKLHPFYLLNLHHSLHQEHTIIVGLNYSTNKLYSIDHIHKISRVLDKIKLDNQDMEEQLKIKETEIDEDFKVIADWLSGQSIESDHKLLAIAKSLKKP